MSGGEDRVRRMKQYLLAMGVRTLSFPLAVWAFVEQRYVLAGILAFLAAVIPSFAVMLANAVDRRQAPTTDELRSPTLSLGPARQPPEDRDASGSPRAADPADPSGSSWPAGSPPASGASLAGPQVIPGSLLPRDEQVPTVTGEHPAAAERSVDGERPAHPERRDVPPLAGAS